MYLLRTKTLFTRGVIIPSVIATSALKIPNPLSQEEFIAWLRERSRTETIASIADTMCCARLTIYYWMWGKRRPSRQALALAAILRGFPREM